MWTDIITKIRYLINDISTSTSDIFTYDASAIFTLSESNVVSITRVLRNNSTSGVSYTYDSTLNKVTISSTLTTGDTIQIDYISYSNYSDTELGSYIESAILHLSMSNYENFSVESGNEIYPTPTDREEKLITMISALLINPDNRTIRLPDLTISAPNDVPTNLKIKQLIGSFKKDTHGIFGIWGY